MPESGMLWTPDILSGCRAHPKVLSGINKQFCDTVGTQGFRVSGLMDKCFYGMRGRIEFAQPTPVSSNPNISSAVLCQVIDGVIPESDFISRIGLEMSE